MAEEGGEEEEGGVKEERVGRLGGRMGKRGEEYKTGPRY